MRPIKEQSFSFSGIPTLKQVLNKNERSRAPKEAVIEAKAREN